MKALPLIKTGLVSFLASSKESSTTTYLLSSAPPAVFIKNMASVEVAAVASGAVVGALLRYAGSKAQVK